MGQFGSSDAHQHLDVTSFVLGESPKTHEPDSLKSSQNTGYIHSRDGSFPLPTPSEISDEEQAPYFIGMPDKLSSMASSYNSAASGNRE